MNEWEYKCTACKAIVYLSDKDGIEVTSFKCPHCESKNLLVVYYEEETIRSFAARLYDLESRILALEDQLQEKKDEQELN